MYLLLACEPGLTQNASASKFIFVANFIATSKFRNMEAQWPGTSLLR